MSKTLTVKARNAVEAEAEARRILAERGDPSEPVHPTESPAFDATRPEYHLWQFLLVEPEVRTIDITPTWSAIYRVLVGVLQNPEAPVTAHRQAWAQLHRMAELADMYVAVMDEEFNKDPKQYLPVLTDPDQPEGRA